jgi:hypothetical protein
VNAGNDAGHAESGEGSEASVREEIESADERGDTADVLESNYKLESELT